MDGNPLPGVTVTISAPQMQGTRTAVTDVNGNYNFTAIPPGQYTVRFEMESMQTVTRTSQIGLGQTGRTDVVYLNVPDLSQSFGFNPLGGVAPLRRSLAAAGLIEAFKKIFNDSWGVRLEHFFRHALLLLLDHYGVWSRLGVA